MTSWRIQKVATYLNMVLFCTLFMVFLHPERVRAAASTKSCLYTLQAATTTNILPDSIESVTTSSRTECLARCVGVNLCTGVVYCPDDDVCYLMATTSDQGSVLNATCQMFVEEDALTQTEALSPTTETTTSCANGGNLVGATCDCLPSFTGTQCETRIEDCTDVSLHVSNSPGTYIVWPTIFAQPFNLECQGVSIMMMFRNKTISGCEATPVTYLDVPWADYKSGFNNSDCYMWLGLEKIHALTSVRPYMLYVSLKKFDTTPGQVSYSAFYVGDEASEYQLSVSGFTGDSVFGDRFNLGDLARTLDGSHFCAKDHCNNSAYPCAEWHSGAWWSMLDDCQTNPHHRYDIAWVLADSVSTEDCKGIYMFIVPV
ncbi:angiopoietin-related protein 3-like [Haliotis cracherodii]|uniref:angiopoietin-related protein 3-like n=1 Tax=Haliotis cracherodii TaxID=6455 RepID=UPI0039EA609E